MKLGGQAIFAPLGAIGEQVVAGHADGGRDGEGIDEGSVGDHAGQIAGCAPRCAETPLGKQGVEGENPSLARGHGRVEGEDAIIEPLVGLDGPRALDAQGQHLEVAGEADVHLAQGRGGLVLEHIDAARLE